MQKSSGIFGPHLRHKQSFSLTLTVTVDEGKIAVEETIFGSRVATLGEEITEDVSLVEIAGCCASVSISSYKNTNKIHPFKTLEVYR